MIQLEDVSKVYPSANGEVRALDGVSLSIEEGDFVAVRGPSGCGKSTLLSLVGGLALPTTGRVTVAGREVSSMNATQRAGFRAELVGYVFQMFHLLPYLNVVDNVLVASDEGNSLGVRTQADTLLKNFGMADRMTHRPGELSAGERQRVAMARALLNQPRLLLADEPTGNLDPDNASAVLDLIGQFHADGGTILLVTHDADAAQRAARVICFEQGKLQGELVADEK